MGPNAVVKETVFAAGFRRTSPVPPPTAVARLRTLLLGAARGRSDSVREGLAKIGAWKNLPLLMSGPWFGEPLRDGATSRRSLERRLRLLGTPTISLADASAAPRGQPVTLTGTARVSPGRRPVSYIWTNSETNQANVRLLVEEGHDFFLVDEPAGSAALVVVSGGHLITGERVDDGDRVEVFGFVDHVVDPRVARTAASARQPPVCLAVRSGDELTLIVRKLG